MAVVNSCGPMGQIESPPKEEEEHQKTVVKCERSFKGEEFEGMESGGAVPPVKSEPLFFVGEMTDFVKEEPCKHQEAKIECMKELNEGGLSRSVQSEPKGTLEKMEAFLTEEPEELHEIKTECDEFYEAEEPEVAWGESLQDVKAEQEECLIMKGKREAVEMSGNEEILQQSSSQTLNKVEDGRNQANSRDDPAESEEFSSGCFSTSKKGDGSFAYSNMERNVQVMLAGQIKAEVSVAEQMTVVSSSGPREQIESPLKEGQEHQKTVVKCEGSFNAEEFEGMESGALPLVKSEPLGFFVEMGDFVKEEPYKHQEAKIECMKDLNEGGLSPTVQSEPKCSLELVEAFLKEEPEELQEIRSECGEFYEAEESEAAQGASLPDMKTVQEEWLMKGKREALEMMLGNEEILQQSFSQTLNKVEDGRNQANSRGDSAEPEEFSSGCTYTSESKKFSCDQCPYKTNSKWCLKRHCLTHNSEKKYACDQCSYKTNDKNNLRNHFLTHNSEKKFVCHQCTYKTNKKCNWLNHYLSHINGKKFACGFCLYKTNFKNSLKRHYLIHNSDKILACDQCPYKTNQRSHLKRHYLSHMDEKKFACDQCTYKTNYTGDLRKHYLTHGSEKKLACDQCSYKTNRKSNLQRHCLTHNSEKKFACDQCFYNTNNKATLKRHYLKRHYLSHNSERKLACDE